MIEKNELVQEEEKNCKGEQSQTGERSESVEQTKNSEKIETGKQNQTVQSREIPEQSKNVKQDIIATTGEAGKKKKKKVNRISGSLFAKMLAFVLLFIAILGAVASIIGCIFAADQGLYVSNWRYVIVDDLYQYSNEVALYTNARLGHGGEAAALSYLADKNVEVAVLDKHQLYDCDCLLYIWKSYSDEECKYTEGNFSDIFYDIRVSSGAFAGDSINEYIFRVYYNPDMSIHDDIQTMFLGYKLLYEYRFILIGTLFGCVLVSIFCFVFLVNAAGKRKGREETVPGLFTKIYTDIFFIITIAVISLVFMTVDSICYSMTSYSTTEQLISMAISIFISAMLGMVWVMDLAIRIKIGAVWKHSLIYKLFACCANVFRMLWKGVLYFVRKIPYIWKSILVIFVLATVGLCIVAIRTHPLRIILWLCFTVLILLVVSYFILVCRNLLDASRKLANGQLKDKLETDKMFGAFKEHGENLNSMGVGIGKAVAEKMRSEHLKTELITNVSHDIKTPITSIINYANFLVKLGEDAEVLTDPEQPEESRILVNKEHYEEYTEVLLRQSKRLKKLLEDLVEASKATTGNLVVNLAPCEVGVLLTQAVGEYQQKMEEMGLELRSSQPEEEIRILADGRHLWRVFDNLLNNICKYAQENSRVYLSLEHREDKVYITFRNMSKYALNVSAEELEERFVRGDKSRHMEGNGLGLSIAKSLTELQNGTMSITIDGDLFKVILTFDRLKED